MIATIRIKHEAANQSMPDGRAAYCSCDFWMYLSGTMVGVFQNRIQSNKQVRL